MAAFLFLLHSRRLCTGLLRENPCDRETASACAGIFAMKYDENAYMMQDFLCEIRCMDQTRRACADGFSTFLEKILRNA